MYQNLKRNVPWLCVHPIMVTYPLNGVSLCYGNVCPRRFSFHLKQHDQSEMSGRNH